MKGTLLAGNCRAQILGLAAPLVIGNILQQLYNTVDSLIIGRFLGTDAFSAVGIAGTIMNLFIFVLTGFCVGVSVIFSQLYGSGDRKTFRREVFISVTLGAAIALLLSGLFLSVMRPVLRMINSPEELIGSIEAYLTVIILGMIATYFYNLFSSLLRAIGDTRAATIFLTVAVLVNVGLDYLFVGGLAMGIAGAAWATVLSQALSAVLCLFYILRRDRELICTRADFGFDRRLVRRTLTYGFTSALHQSSLYIGKIFVQGAVNLLGTAGIAAYTATMRIEGFANSFGTSYGQAVTVFISQNRGAGNRERVRQGFRNGMAMAVIIGAVLSAALYLSALPGVRIFLDSTETRAVTYGVDYMRHIAFFYIMCFTGNTFVGYFRGVGRVYVPLAATTLHITVRALLSHLWIHSLGLTAVAYATGIGWAVMTLFQITMVIWNLRRREQQSIC